jgi:hypothetical protein
MARRIRGNYHRADAFDKVNTDEEKLKYLDTIFLHMVTDAINEFKNQPD